MPVRTDPVTAVKRYTLCGEASAEARVAQDLSRIAAGLYSDIGDRLRALVLVGGFARGEGSVLYLEDGEPHADPGYQLLALFDRRAERERGTLREIAATWTRLLRTQVDVKPFTVAELPRTPRSLFWFHVGCGQRVTLIGDPTAIFAVPPRSVSELDPDEAVRLMTEATVALALASLRPAPRAETLLDRLHRVAFACGDAALLQRGIYAESMARRAELLEESEPCVGLAELYAAALRYRADPRRSAAAAAHSEHELCELREHLERVQLELEAQRIGSPRDPEAYARFHSRDSVHPVPALRRLSRLARRATPARAGDRLRRAAVALAYDKHNAAARASAARVLRRATGIADTGDEALAAALRMLARRVLHDPQGHPFSRWRTEPRSLAEWLAQRVGTSDALQDAPQ